MLAMNTLNYHNSGVDRCVLHWVPYSEQFGCIEFYLQPTITLLDIVSQYKVVFVYRWLQLLGFSLFGFFRGRGKSRLGVFNPAIACNFVC